MLSFTSTGNNPPNITAPASFMVTVNMESIIEITVVDTNLRSFGIIGGDVEGGVLAMVEMENGTALYTFTWTPPQFLDQPIIFLATDDRDASTQYEPRIEFCSCMNGGECTLSGVLDQTANPLDLNCICPAGKLRVLGKANIVCQCCSFTT